MRITKLMLLGGLSVVGLLVSCTKEVPYKYEYKEKVMDKAEIDTEAQYIYVPSYQNASRSSDVARPYWMGDQKIVKLAYTENALRVFEVEQDTRFQGNETNNKTVLEIPATYVSYRCAQDRLGACTNKEEENTELPWDKKEKVKLAFQDTKITETSILPIELDEVFGSSCYKPVSSHLKGYEVSADGLNIQIERTFNVDLECMEFAEHLSEATVNVVYHYSLMKMSSLTSNGYKAVQYPASDENTFGFFTTEQFKLDVDNRDTVNSQKMFMNRWNPARKEVVYYLSDEFSKEENKGLRDSTFEVFKRLNQGLEKSGAGFRLSLRDPEGRQAGDIRNSMIVMVEDPVASNVIGYGPTVANPQTGEIVSGRVVMYLGTIKKFIATTYEEIREQRAEAAAKTLKVTPTAVTAIQSQDLKSRTEKMLKSLNELGLNLDEIRGASSSEDLSDEASGESLTGIAKGVAPIKAASQVRAATLEKVRRDLLNRTAHTDTEFTLSNRLGALAKHCNYPAEMIDFQSAVAGSLAGIPDGELEPWENLSADKKAKILEAVIPVVWIPTLIHEMGHNLGLRHNFAGSEDKANFYSKSELEAMGITREIPYSSVMDYGFSDLNTLPVLGKYDVAALRFGYTRQVEDMQGKLIAVPEGKAIADVESLAKSEKTGLRAFDFCTDEHVGANPNCKMFDEGTTISEIVHHQIEKNYLGYYKLRNFRHGARNFSLLGDGAYLARVKGTFANLRQVLERYDYIRSLVPEDAAEWNTVDFLVDYKKAVIEIGQMMASVLREPDRSCVIKSKEATDLSEAVLVPIADLDASAVRCADIADRLNDKYEVVTEVGKHLLSKKDPNNHNPYIDQIDIRGVWVDKLAAIETILRRNTGSLSDDKTLNNMLDFQTPIATSATESVAMSALLKKTLTDALFDRFVGKFTFADNSGQEQSFVASYTQGATFLPASLSSSARRNLDLPADGALLQAQLLKAIAKYMPNKQDIPGSQQTLAEFSVFHAVPNNGRSIKNYERLEAGPTVYLALKENTVANQMIRIVKLKRIIAGGAAEVQKQKKEVTRLLSGLSDDLITALVSGELGSESYFLTMLSLLPETR